MQLKIKALELNRETLRALNADEQIDVQGAGTTTRFNCGTKCSADTYSNYTTRIIYCC